MHTSVRSDYLHCSGTTSLTSRTAVYGPVRTVVWQGSAGDCRPYADLVGFPDKWPRSLMRFARQVVNDKRTLSRGQTGLAGGLGLCPLAGSQRPRGLLSIH